MGPCPGVEAQDLPGVLDVGDVVEGVGVVVLPRLPLSVPRLANCPGHSQGITEGSVLHRVLLWTRGG